MIKYKTMKQVIDTLFEIFSTREIAIAIYLIIIVIAVFFSKKIRPSAINVIKCVLTPKLIIPFIILIIYSGGITYLFSRFSFWKWQFLKDIIIWTLFAGVPVCYKAINSGGKEKGYFKNIVVDNLKFSALVEFFTGSFTFTLILELILQPVLVLLGALDAIASRDEKNKSAQKIIQVLLVIIGFVMIALSIKNAVDSLTFDGSKDLLICFLIPIVFSIFFVPASYILAIYAKYETLFLRLKFREPKNNKWKYRFKIIWHCNFRLKRVILFQKGYVYKIYQTIDEQQYSDVIDEFIKEVKSK